MTGPNRISTRVLLSARRWERGDHNLDQELRRLIAQVKREVRDRPVTSRNVYITYEEVVGCPPPPPPQAA